MHHEPRLTPSQPLKQKWGGVGGNNNNNKHNEISTQHQLSQTHVECVKPRQPLWGKKYMEATACLAHPHCQLTTYLAPHTLEGQKSGKPPVMFRPMTRPVDKELPITTSTMWADDFVHDVFFLTICSENGSGLWQFSVQEGVRVIGNKAFEFGGVKGWKDVRWVW